VKYQLKFHLKKQVCAKLELCVKFELRKLSCWLGQTSLLPGWWLHLDQQTPYGVFLVTYL